MEERPCSIDEDQKLQLLLKNLEHEWDFIKKRPEKTLYRTSSASTKIMTKTLGLLNEISPRKLMHSLQQHKIISPTTMDEEEEEEVAWKVRTNDLAVEEILRERRAAIESGKLKGRRLFDEVVEDVEVRSDFSYESDDINNYEDEIIWPRKEHLSPSYPPRCSYSLSSSSCSSMCGDENILQNGSGTEVATIVEKELMGNGWAKLNFVKVWRVVIISLIVFVVGIIAMWSFGVYEDEEAILILTPT